MPAECALRFAGRLWLERVRVEPCTQARVRIGDDLDFGGAFTLRLGAGGFPPEKLEMQEEDGNFKMCPFNLLEGGKR